MQQLSATTFLLLLNRMILLNPLPKCGANFTEGIPTLKSAWFSVTLRLVKSLKSLLGSYSRRHTHRLRFWISLINVLWQKMLKKLITWENQVKLPLTSLENSSKRSKLSLIVGNQQSMLIWPRKLLIWCKMMEKLKNAP